MPNSVPHRPLTLPPVPDAQGLADWRARLARLPDADEIDAAQEIVFRARDGLEFETRLFNLRRRWRMRGVDDADMDAVESRWRSIAARADVKVVS